MIDPVLPFKFPNTPNTFNTFWKGIERDGCYRDSPKSIETVKPEGLEIDKEDTERSSDFTSFTANVTSMSKEEEDVEHSTEITNTSMLQVP